MSRPTLFALLLVGCGASCPEPTASNDNEGHTGGEEAPAPLPPTSEVFAGFDGRWYFVEPDGDEVEVMMEIAGASGTLREGRGREPLPMTVEIRTNGMAMITFSEGDGDRGRAFLVPRGPHSMDAFQFGDDDALIGRREGPLPAFLQGPWVLSSLQDSRRIEMHVEGTTARVIRNDELRVIELTGLVREGPTHDVVGAQQGERRGEMNWLRLSEIEPEVYLVREGNDDDFLVMHRPGAVPAWVTEASRSDRVRPPAVEAVAPPAAY